MIKANRERMMGEALGEVARWRRIYRSQRRATNLKRRAAHALGRWTDRVAYLESLVSGWGQPIDEAVG